MAMPYGCLDAQRLSRPSRVGMEKALDRWQKSMQSSKHKTYFVVAGYDDDRGQEIERRTGMIVNALEDKALLSNIVEVSAHNEEGLAQTIARVRELLPIESLTVFVASRNAESIKAVFRRKFGKTLTIKKYKAEFEFDHPWISTSTSFAWLGRNWLVRLWFELKKRRDGGCQNNCVSGFARNRMPTFFRTSSGSRHLPPRTEGIPLSKHLL